MIFKNVSKEDFLNLISIKQENRLVFMFIKDVNLESQLFLKNDPVALQILKIIKLCGGIVRRTDLVNIAFDNDKNIYAHIKNLEKFKLIKMDGQRDSSIYLTATALSVLNRRKIKNGIKPGKATYDNLEKSKFLLSLYKIDNFMLCNEFQIIEHIVNTRFEVLAKQDDRALAKFNDEILTESQELIRMNCYIMNDCKTIAMYATTKNEFFRKFNALINSRLMLKGLNLNINKIILPGIEELIDLDRNEVIKLYEDYPILGDNFKNVNIVHLAQIC